MISVLIMLIILKVKDLEKNVKKVKKFIVVRLPRLILQFIKILSNNYDDYTINNNSNISTINFDIVNLRSSSSNDTTLLVLSDTIDDEFTATLTI